MESGGAKNSYTPSATTSTPSTSPKMSPSLRPRHFISREDGTLTALIAVDELPPAVRIAGVPQNLQPSQIEGMKSCGVEPHRHQYYIIEATKEESLNGPGNQEINHQAGDNNENAALSKGYQAPNPEASTIPGLSGVQNGQRLHGVESWRHDVKGVDHTQVTYLIWKPSHTEIVLTLPRLPSMQLRLPTLSRQLRELLMDLLRRTQLRLEPSARKYIALTGYVGENVTIRSKGVSTSTRCQTKRPWTRSGLRDIHAGIQKRTQTFSQSPAGADVLWSLQIRGERRQHD